MNLTPSTVPAANFARASVEAAVEREVASLVQAWRGASAQAPWSREARQALTERTSGARTVGKEAQPERAAIVRRAQDTGREQASEAPGPVSQEKR